MKSIYSPRPEFKQALTVNVRLKELLKKYGYTDFFIVIAKDDPQDSESILYDTHYVINHSSVLDIASDLVEKLKDELEEI